MSKVNWQERLNQLLSTGKNRSYFTVGTTVLFVVVMSIVGVVPAISSLSSQAEDNVKRDRIITKLEKKLSDLKTLTLSKEQNTSLVDYFNQIMPEDEHQESTINLINALASKRGLIVSSFIFDKENRELIDKVTVNYGDRIGGMFLTIQGEGSKQGILEFIKDIEASALIMEAQDISISRTTGALDAGGNGIRYILNLKLIIYSYKNIT